MSNVIKSFRNIFFFTKRSKAEHCNSKKEINGSAKIKKVCNNENDELFLKEIKKISDKIEFY